MKKILLYLFTFIFSFISCVNYVLANELGDQLNNEVSNEKKIEEIKPKSNEKVSRSEYSDKELFGDEQSFPFVAGLGKNAAH